MPLILGIVGGIVLLCCGGPVGVWLFWIKPAGEKFVKEVEAEASRIKAQAEQNQQSNQLPQTVRPPEAPPAVTLTVVDFHKLSETDRRKYDKKWVQLSGKVPSLRENTYPNKPADGYIELGVARVTSLTCNFGPDEWAMKPKFDDDKEYSVLGYFEAKAFGTSLSWCRVVGESAGATPVAVAALLSDLTKYKGKLVEVSGVIKAAGALPLGGEAVLVEGGNNLSLKMTFDPLLWPKHKLNTGGTITARGTVSTIPTGGYAFMTVSSIQSYTAGTGTPPPTPSPGGPVIASADQMIQSFIKDVTSPDTLYFGKQVKVTGKVVDVTRNDIFFGGTEANAFQHYVSVRLADATTTIKKGDTVTLVAKYFGYSTSLTNGVRTISLIDGKQEGVSVDPPKPDAPKPDAVKLKAEELAAEFEKDASAASKKYADKTLTLSGTVERTSATGVRISLKGLAATGNKKAFVVDLLMGGETRDEAKKVKVGDSVTMSGKFANFRVATASAPNTVLLTSGKIEK